MATFSALQVRILSLTFAIPRLLAAGVTVALMLIPVHGQTTPAKPRPVPVSLDLELVSDSEGVDLTPFMKHLSKAVKYKTLATMPKFVSLGEQGIVTIKLQVQKDGTLLTEPATATPAVIEVVNSSGKKPLDDLTVAAVQSAAPFGHLPESLSAQSVELKLTFYYNLPLPSP